MDYFFIIYVDILISLLKYLYICRNLKLEDNYYFKYFVMMKKILFTLLVVLTSVGFVQAQSTLLEFDATNTTASAGTLTNIIGDDWTVVRNSIATYQPTPSTVSSVGVSVPRIQNGAVLIEDAFTNRYNFSEDFSSNGSTINGTNVIHPTIPAPDGTLTANHFSGSVIFTQNSASNGEYKSVWARTVSGTGQAHIGGHNSVAKYLVTLTETWQRFDYHVDESESFGVNSYPVDLRAAGSLTEVLVWGYNLGTDTNLSSYIKTPDATDVTREADVITVAPPVGTTSIIEWINGVEQTPITIIPSIFTMKDGTTKILMTDSASGPEINVTGNGISIPSGNSPIVDDHTDFGQVAIGSPVMHTFTVENIGDSDLTINFGTENSAYFTFVPPFGFGQVISPGSSTTINVTFDPVNPGVQTGKITIYSNDPDEATYIVNITAEGIQASDGTIDVQGNGVSIANGDLTPDIADDTDFGQVSNNSFKSVPYTIFNNDPSENLSINKIDFVIGSDPEFVMDNLPVFPVIIAPGGQITFDVVFFPTTDGVYEAIVNIENSDDTPYHYRITGEAVDVLIGGDIMITQYYSGFSGNDNWIEIKNISGAPIGSGTYFLAMYDQDRIPNIEVSAPNEVQSIPFMTTGAVLLFKNSLATIPGSGNLGFASQITTPVCNFDGDDVILISRTNDASCYGNRQDIIGDVETINAWGKNKSFIKGGCATELPHADFLLSDWIDIPIVEVDNADPSTNLALGTQVLGPTIFNGSWSNLSPDRSRTTIIASSFSGANVTVTVCNLVINSDVSAVFNSNGTSNHSIIIYGDLTVDGSLIIGDTESLVTLDPLATLGNITKIEKSETLYNLHDNTYWSSPVQNSQIQNVFPDVNPVRIFEYKAGDENPIYAGTNYRYWWNKPSGSMDVGYGYAVEGPAAPVDGNDDYITPLDQIINFIGIPNNGTLSLNVYYKGQPDVGDENENFNLIGNPYPTAIDIESFLTNNPAVNEIALWTHATPISGGTEGEFLDPDYVYYNITGSTTPGVSNNIGSGQGFMTRTNNSGDIDFFNHFKMIDANDQFFKSENSKKDVVNKEIEKDRIWLLLSDDQRTKSNILIGFIDEATDGVDFYYDSYGFNSEKQINLYSKVADSESKFLIQGLGTFNEDKIVSLGYDSKSIGNLKISVIEKEGVLKDIDIYLVDNFLGITHNLNDSDYTFEQTATGEFPNRFVLQFAGAALGIDDFEKNNDFSIANTYDGFSIHASKIVTKVKVYDMLGRLLIENIPNKQSFSLKVDNIKAGTVLIIESTLDNGAILSKKAIKF